MSIEPSKDNRKKFDIDLKCGKVREQIAMLPEPANLQPLLDSLQALEEYGWELEEDIEEIRRFATGSGEIDVDGGSF